MSKPFKSTITKEVERELASSKLKKQPKKTKKENTMNKTIITTVTITLTAVAALAGMFLLGMGYNQSVNERIRTEAKALSSVSQPSKQ